MSDNGSDHDTAPWHWQMLPGEDTSECPASSHFCLNQFHHLRVHLDYVCEVIFWVGISTLPQYFLPLRYVDMVTDRTFRLNIIFKWYSVEKFSQTPYQRISMVENTVSVRWHLFYDFGNVDFITYKLNEILQYILRTLDIDYLDIIRLCAHLHIWNLGTI